MYVSQLRNCVARDALIRIKYAVSKVGTACVHPTKSVQSTLALRDHSPKCAWIAAVGASVAVPVVRATELPQDLCCAQIYYQNVAKRRRLILFNGLVRLCSRRVVPTVLHVAMDQVRTAAIRGGNALLSMQQPSTKFWQCKYCNSSKKQVNV